MKMPKAYSYLRFSTPEQSKGDSARRQSDAAREYAQRYGLDLDESLTFKDLGVSAFRGKNVQEGALGAFLSAVDSDHIKKGSYLLVEALDRLSRAEPLDALDQLRSILRRGVHVVTLKDGKRLTDGDFRDPLKLFGVLFEQSRSHEESLTKSIRVRAAWQNKRNRAQSEGRKLTARCPAWLTLDRAKNAFVADPPRKKVVQRIFAMTLAGHGKSVIERRFNAEAVPTFGKADNWHGSYIQKILENEAVCGVFQPMRIELKDGKRLRVPDGEPIAAYFPPVIERGTFERARRSRSARRIASGRKGENFSNLFTGLAVCGNCGAPMHYVNKGNGSKGGAYLVCSNAKRAVSNCKAASWKYNPVEAFFILCMEELSFDELFPDLTSTSREALERLENTKLEKEAERATAKRKLKNLVVALADNPKQPEIQAELNTTQVTFDNLSGAIRTLETQIEDERERAKTAEHDFGQVQTGVKRLIKAHKDGLQRLLDKAHETRGQELYDLRSRLHQLLKRTVQEIKLHPSKGTVPAPEHSGEWHGTIAVRFQSTNEGRVLYVEKGLKKCHSYPVRNGIEITPFRRSITLKGRERKGP
jgi:DNA invertase Pin-like site-specific DNA recombinase